VTNPHRSTRRGFTLIEVLISLAVLGIIGVGMVRLLMSQSRFAEGQMSLRNARTVSRNAMNIMLTDLRMVQDNGGLVAAGTDSIVVRVPVAFGLICTTGGSPVVSLLPADSAMTALAQYAGWAYRDSVPPGTYVYMDAATPRAVSLLSAAPATTCTDSTSGPGILSMTYTPPQAIIARTSRIVSLPDAALPGSPGSPRPGWPMFIYQQITYKFAASTAYPGRRGLFRVLKNGTPTPVSDEIVAPFDSATARFRFYVVGADVAQSDVPPVLNTVRGIELVLAGSSPRKPQDRELAQQAMVTGVFFMNRTNTNINQ
jgi:prepilin-type N-terminal cleavage/methylation domain-containing protein